MKAQCNFRHCFPDTACALGHNDRLTCNYWEAAESGEADGVQVRPNGSDVAWNGYALGTSDLAILAGKRRPVVVGLIGPERSGKTSLLAFVYMWLLSHGQLGGLRFSGSWTLGGWELLVRPCRWTGTPPPSFPAHTSSTGRHPGILHVALRDPGFGVKRDVLFTDAPGEWFTDWSRSPNESHNDGARWVIDHSDALVLLVDSAGLADTRSLSLTRRLTYDLVERVAAERSSPVVIIWTKDDVVVPELVRSSLNRSFEEFLPQAQVLRTTTEAPTTIEKAFAQVLGIGDTGTVSFQSYEPRRSQNPFLALRGVHGTS